MRSTARIATLGVALSMAGLLFGCGTPQNAAAKFMKVDATNHVVTLDLVAGYNPNNDYDNFNGYANGAMTVTVPVGYTVKVHYVNASGIPVDLGVYDQAKQLAFKGAGDSLNTLFVNAVAGVVPGDSENYKFVASRVGTYEIANYINRFPQYGNTLQDYHNLGMWDVLKVVNSGSPGITVS